MPEAVVEGGAAVMSAIGPADRGDAPEYAVSVRDLVKSFRREGGEVITPVDRISLDIARGELVVLLGPSGCGKTTLLRCIAGLETPESGWIELGGTVVADPARRHIVPPERRPVSMVFQSYALWPHMTVWKNVAYPLKRLKLRREEVEARVARALEMVAIGHLGKQHPGRLSGGQQQRVALARALVANNDLVLFDEPLSNVDAKVRESLRRDLKAMQRELGFTAVYVTHDQVEAMELATRIAALSNGRIEQDAAPEELYHRPRSRYVADFIGSANILDGSVTAREGTSVAFTWNGTRMHGVVEGPVCTPGSAVRALIRPEAFHIAESSPARAGDNQVSGVVTERLFGGSQTQLVVDVAGTPVLVWTASRGARVGLGDRITLEVHANDVWVLDADG